MNANFSRSLALVLKEEGGNVDDRRDPGGRTSQGITQRTYDGWRANHGEQTRDVFLIDPAERDAIYKAEYWDVIGGDELPGGIDYATMDYAVHSGTGRAAKTLQQIVGAPADGSIGTNTLAAVRNKPAAATITMLCNDRLAFLESLPTWAVYGRGWGARVARVQAAALGMVA